MNFNLSEDTKIEFYTLSGKLLESVFISSGKQVLNIDFLSSGTYIIKANGIAYSYLYYKSKYSIFLGILFLAPLTNLGQNKTDKKPVLKGYVIDKETKNL